MKKIIKEELDSIRKSILEENISYLELVRLQSLAEHIPEHDTLLREWAGVPEMNDEGV